MTLRGSIFRQAIGASAWFAIGMAWAGCSDDAGESESARGGVTETPGGGTDGGSAARAGASASTDRGGSEAPAADGGRAGSGSPAAGHGGGGAASGGFTNMGVCGQRGRSTVDATRFEGYEEFYILADRGFGDDICVVRFDVKRVGDAPPGCDDPTADVDCLWTHLIEYSNPTVMTDVDGVCAKSERGLDMAEIQAITGSRVAYGFVSEFAGHNSVLMKYDEQKDMWDAQGNATWDESAAALRFDRRDGICRY